MLLLGIDPWFMGAGLTEGGTGAMLSESMGSCLHSATSWGKRGKTTGKLSRLNQGVGGRVRIKSRQGLVQSGVSVEWGKYRMGLVQTGASTDRG